jgi:TolB-like protein
MTPDRWARVKEVFHSALDRELAARRGFVAAACEGDAELQQEVEALLEQHEQAGDFLEPPARSAAEIHLPLARVLEPGRRLGPYDVSALIGSGGMGEVYRARDTRLGREVAIKVLPAGMGEDPEALARFTRETRAVAALSHPSILAIHDVGIEDGVSYAVMELLEGQSLRSRMADAPLPWREAVEITAAVADGLAAAHSKGIVHRDLKPENIFLTSDGQVKILDFGLARAQPYAEHDDAAGDPTRELLTRPGMVLGTVGYMSPEQLRGDAADGRSDVFALGCVLHEVVSGRRPFAGQTPAEAIAAVLKEEPLSLQGSRTGLPPQLLDVIRHCLEKNATDRFQSARDLSVALRSTLAGARVALPSGAAQSWTTLRPRRKRWGIALLLAATLAAGGIWLRHRQDGGRPDPAAVPLAVLPFENLAGSAEDEYLAEGITDGVLTGLARSPHLRVLSLQSVRAHKGRPDVGQLRELGVTYVVEGSVQRAARNLRVNARLIEVSSGYQAWANAAERPAGEIFALQDDVARQVMGALRVAGAVVPASPLTRNADAYDAYLRGRFHVVHGEETEDAAITLFEKAVALDPQFALAHAALGNGYAQRFFYDDPDPRWREKAYAEIGKALAIDPDLAEAYLARGNLNWTWPNRFPHERVARDYQRALALNPSLGDARVALARLYQHVGLLDEALVQLKEALRVEPDLQEATMRIAVTHVWQHKAEQALAELAALPGGLDAMGYLPAVALLELGRQAEARRRVENILVKTPDDYRSRSVYALLLARAGESHRARQEVERAAAAVTKGRGYSSHHHAEYYMGAAWGWLGDKPKAVEWLRQAAAEGFPCYPYYEGDPNLEPLRQDAAFVAFMAELRAQWQYYRRTL